MLADLAGDRLAARRARPPLARLRPARPAWTTRARVAVGPYEANLENARKIRDDWQIGKPDPSATRSLLETIRQATPEEASAEAVKLLNQGVAAESLWDAVILAASETADAELRASSRSTP